MTRNTGYFDHQCDLPITVEGSILELPPYLPKYKLWFYSLRKLFLVHEENVKTKRFFRSYASVRAEKKRHAEGEYSKIIHPFSKCAIYKEKLICLLWMTSCFLDPIKISFFMSCDDSSYIIFKIQWTLDALFLLNVVISCFTGYCVSSTKEIILDPKQVLKRRALWYLIPETIASLPFKEVAVAVSGINPRNTRISALSALRLFRALRFVEMIRILTEIQQELRVPETIFTLGLVFLMAFYMIHWLACCLYFVSISYYTWDDLPRKSWLRVTSAGADVFNSKSCSGITDNFINFYVLVILRTACHFFGAGEGYIPIELTMEKLACAVVVIIGFIYCQYAMAKVLELFGSANISERKYEELIHQLSEYMRSKNLSDKLKKHLLTYYEYKYQKKFFKEEEILSTLSEHLRCEVSLHTCKNLFNRVHILNGISRSSLGSIVGFMQREIYLPNDVVLKHGEPMLKMMWVCHGTLAVYYGPDAVEILHFEDGDHFCDLAITNSGGLTLLSVVALEITEIFTINRKDIKHCTSFLKEISEKVLRLSKEKKNIYKTLASMMATGESQNMVLAELRKGRILEKDRWRKRRKRLSEYVKS